MNCQNCGASMDVLERLPQSGLIIAYRCPRCGDEYWPYDVVLPPEAHMEVVDEAEQAFVERYVADRIAALFPPGSEGPPDFFDWGGLYADAYEAWATRDVIDAPFFPEPPEEDGGE
jgi:hypothetical protein